MFNWLAPLSTISAPESLPSFKAPGKPQQQPLLRKFLHSPPPVLLDLLCGLSDDLATFYKLGLVPRRIGQRAEKLADWCWFSGTLVDLVEVGVELSVIGGAISQGERGHFCDYETLIFVQLRGASIRRACPYLEQRQRQVRLRTRLN